MTLSPKRRAVLLRFAKGLAASVLAGVIGFLTSDTVRDTVESDPLFAALLPVVVAGLLAVEKHVRWFNDESEDEVEV